VERTQPALQDLARHVAQVIPLFWILALATVVIGLGEIALLAIAVRRQPGPANGGGAAAPERRPSAWFAVAAIAGPVLLAGLIAASIRIGHATLLRGIAATTPDENVKVVVAGLEAFTNAKALGPFLLGPVLGLAVMAASLHAAATLNVRPRPLLTASLLFVGAGLSPFLWGTFRYATQTIKVLAGVAGVDVAMKEVMITRGLEETLELLDWWAMFGTIGFGVALVLAIVVTVRAGVGPSSPRVSWTSSVLCLAAAAGLFLAAEPLRAENTTPWPASPSVGAALTNNVVATPDVDGPDEVPPAELVTVTNDLTLAGGVTRNSEELRDTLVVMRNNYRLLHPDEWGGDENLVIICAPETRSERLIEILQWAKLTQYRRPAFAFGKRTTLERPLMGTLPRWKWTAAKALIPGVGPQEPMPVVPVTVDDYPTCDAVARAVAAIRRGGKIAGLTF
jgi:hypothetical protein